MSHIKIIISIVSFTLGAFDGFAQQLSYSRKSQITAANFGSLNNSFTYDKLGNRLSKQITTGTPLPIALTNFTGRPQSCTSALSWSTANEGSYTGFRMERSTDGGSFSALAFVKAVGSRKYSFTDGSPVPGNNYYRLALIEHSGKESFSNTISVTNTCAILSSASVFPNPAEGTLYLSYSSIAGSVPCTFSIFDIQGRIVLKDDFTTGTGKETHSYNISALPPGNYTARLTSGNAVLFADKVAIVK